MKEPFRQPDTEGNLAVAKTVAHMPSTSLYATGRAGTFSPGNGMQGWHDDLTAFPTPRTLLLGCIPDSSPDTLPIVANAMKTIIGDFI